jgi:putative membrane protein
MKRLSLFLTLFVISLAALPAFAQPSPGPSGPCPGFGGPMMRGPMPCCGHMWHGGWGWHPGMIFGPFILLLALIGLVALIVWLVHCFRHGVYRGYGACPRCGYGHGRAALDILEERFARGEIDKQEFEERRKLLGR